MAEKTLSERFVELKERMDELEVRMGLMERKSEGTPLGCKEFYNVPVQKEFHKEPVLEDKPKDLRFIPVNLKEGKKVG